VKRVRLNDRATLPVLGFIPIDKPILTASSEVAYLITKQGKPHTIGETFVKPAALKMTNTMLGKSAEAKFSQNDTISSRIDDMSDDILAQVVADLISSPTTFSLQLDETTDVSNLN